MPMNSNKTDVYVALVPDTDGEAPLYPAERDRAVRETAKPTLRRERYFVWRLLELAICESLGLTLAEAGLRLDGGRWSSETVDFSLSHGGGALAVAISSAHVGVDIELLDGERDSARVAERFFNAEEREEYLSAPESERPLAFLRIWTAKEAVFKSQGSATFAPSSVDSHSRTVRTESLLLGGRQYILSIASDNETLIHTVEL